MHLYRGGAATNKSYEKDLENRIPQEGSTSSSCENDLWGISRGGSWLIGDSSMGFSMCISGSEAAGEAEEELCRKDKDRIQC